MSQNFYNVVIYFGYSNGIVFLWSLVMKELLVKIFCYCGGVWVVVVDFIGMYMVIFGLDYQLKIFDL